MFDEKIIRMLNSSDRSLNDVLRSFGNAICDVGRRKINKEFKVGMVGLGQRIGYPTFRELLSIPGIDKFMLSNYHMEKVLGARNDCDACDMDRIIAVPYNKLSMLNDADIVIITADGNKVKNVPRIELLDANIPIIEYIADSMHGYQGNVLMVSNPVDELCYLFATVSGMDPRKITGFFDIDRERLHKAFLQATNEYRMQGSDGMFEGYVMGPHNEDLVSIIRQISGYMPESYKFYNDLFEKIVREDTANWGRRQMMLQGHTTGETSKGIKRVVEALMYGTEDQVVCASTILTMEGRNPIYIGYPVSFEERAYKRNEVNGRIAVPRHDLIEDIINDDQSERFNKGYDSIESHVMALVREGEIDRIGPIGGNGNIGSKRSEGAHLNKSDYSPDCNVAAYSGSKVYCWNLDNPNVPVEIYDACEEICAMSYERLGRKGYLVLGLSKGRVSVVDPEKGKEMMKYDSPSDSSIRDVTSMIVDGKVYVIGIARNNGLVVWDVQVKRSLSNHIDGIRSGCYGVDAGTREGKKITAVLGESVYLIDPIGQRVVGSLSVETDDSLTHFNMGAICFADDKIYAGRGGIIHSLNTYSNIDRSYNLGICSNGLAARRVNGHDQLYISSQSERYVGCLNTGNRQVEKYFKNPDNRNGTTSIALAKDYLFAGDSTDGNAMPCISVWHIGNPKEPYRILTGPRKSIRGVLLL